MPFHFMDIFEYEWAEKLPGIRKKYRNVTMLKDFGEAPYTAKKGYKFASVMVNMSLYTERDGDESEYSSYGEYDEDM